MIEVTDNTGLNFFFVALYVEEQTLQIVAIKGVIKTFSKTIPLAKISQLTRIGEGFGERLSFMYENTLYTIVDYGNDVLKYLQL